VRVKFSEMKLERARPYGNGWLACELWRQLQLDRFWEEKLPPGRESVAWAQVLELLVVKPLIEPGSEFRLHRQWFDHSAMDVLLGRDFAVAEKDRLYRCLDRVREHKPDLFVHFAATLERSVPGRVRPAVVRPDEHLRGRGSGGQSEGAVWLPPRWTAGLQASGDRAGDHAGGTSAGVRSAGWQYVG
jgi:hypothetical protein